MYLYLFMLHLGEPNIPTRIVKTDISEIVGNSLQSPRGKKNSKRCLSESVKMPTGFQQRVCLGLEDIGKARQGKFICIAHFIHIGNSKCFT